jgi:site-specific DNA-cytosine methylase
VGSVSVLELYCGIGGFAAALDGSPARSVTAVDIDRAALAVYAENFTHPTLAAEITSLDLTPWAQHFWWLSPPCRPFTRRGQGRDLDDPRSASFQAVVAGIVRHRPPALGLENVPPFAESEAADRLREALTTGGYRWREAVCCPATSGIPMRRRRFYLLALRDDRAAARPDDLIRFEGAAKASAPHGTGSCGGTMPLARYLEPPQTPAREVPANWLDRYARAIDVVEADDPDAVVACVTSAYGRSPVRSGSYVQETGRTRFLRPREIARLMGFADSFRLPPDPRTAYRLLGNSLAVPVVRRLFAEAVEGTREEA